MAKDMAMAGEDERLALKPAAKFVGDDFSPHTLRLYARQGKVAHYRVGRRLFFSKRDLRVLLNRGRVEAR